MAQHKTAHRGRRGRPEPEGAVDVEPRPGPGGHDVGDGVEGIEGAGVHLARLGADDRRTVGQVGEDPGEVVRAHPAFIVRGHADGPSPSEAGHPERLEQGRVDIGTDHDVHRRGADEAFLLDIPARASEDGMAGRGDRDEMGHGRPGREADRRAGRQAEEIDEPFAGDLLDDGRCGRPEEEADVLFPRRGKPVRGERGRHGPTDHETEVAR